MMHHPHAPQSTRRRAFTLAEILIVITIFIFLAGLSFPALKALSNSTRTTTGINAVTVAGTAAQVYARDDYPDLVDVAPGTTEGEYSGTALLFTPRGEIRILFNSQFIKEQGTDVYIEDAPAQRTMVGTTDYWKFDGYTDLPKREPIILPTSTGVLGVARVNNGGTPALVLLAPPFAVRFGVSGQVEYEGLSGTLGYTDQNPGGTVDAQFVYVDGDNGNNGVILDPTVVGSTRANPRLPVGTYSFPSPVPGGTANYFPDYWDPSNNAFVRDDTTANDREMLPFDRIETVIGVIVYDKLKLREYMVENIAAENQRFVRSRYILNDGAAVTDPVMEWLLNRDNTRSFLFNRHTGALFRDPEPRTITWENHYVDTY